MVILSSEDQKKLSNIALCSPTRNFVKLDSKKVSEEHKILQEKVENYVFIDGEFYVLKHSDYSNFRKPKITTYVKAKNILLNARYRIKNCGKESTYYYDLKNEDWIKFPRVCDNRFCNNPQCQDHRLYKYMREHRPQIKALQGNIKKPKGWVFTGYKLRLKDLSRDFIRYHTLRLYKILKNFAESEFSIHLEIKLYPDFYKNDSSICQKCKSGCSRLLGTICKNSGYCFVHWHCAIGGVKDLRFVRKLWNRQISYEKAIKPKELGYYISKYASKTPVFANSYNQELYAILVYKTQMHRFSIRKKDCEKVVRFAKYVNWDIIEEEVRQAYMKDSYLNTGSEGNRYHQFLEEKPPPLEDFDDYDFSKSEIVVDPDYAGNEKATVIYDHTKSYDSETAEIIQKKVGVDEKVVDDDK